MHRLLVRRLARGSKKSIRRNRRYMDIILSIYLYVTKIHTSIGTIDLYVACTTHVHIDLGMTSSTSFHVAFRPPSSSNVMRSWVARTHTRPTLRGRSKRHFAHAQPKRTRLQACHAYEYSSVESGSRYLEYRGRERQREHRAWSIADTASARLRPLHSHFLSFGEAFA